MVAQQAGIKYVGMRNEQAACYAAQAIGKWLRDTLFNTVPHMLLNTFLLKLPWKAITSLSIDFFSQIRHLLLVCRG